MHSKTATSAADADRPKLSYWRKMGAGSLTISLVIHGILLAIGIVWVLTVIPAADPPAEFRPGPGRSAEAATNRPKQSARMEHLASRISAQNVSTNFTLPEPEVSAVATALGPLGGSQNPLGGPGNSDRSPVVPGISTFQTSTGSGNVFGVISQDRAALVGTFYDLKQTPARKPTGITNSQTLEVIQEFVSHGWKENSLSRSYYQAPQKLHQTKIYIPLMSADAAPAAFHCENAVQPGRWIIVYRGTVTPRVSGKYRLVGAADDVLVVRFNNKLMFDHGYAGGTTGQHLAGGTVNILNGSQKDRDKEKLLRDSPMKLPVTFYPYDSTKTWNQAIGGLAAGPTFEAKAGTPYPIEILLSEIPGGRFGAALMIEKTVED